MLGSGQVIRIPANQNIVTGSNQVHQIQMPGRQVCNRIFKVNLINALYNDLLLKLYTYFL